MRARRRFPRTIRGSVGRVRHELQCPTVRRRREEKAQRTVAGCIPRIRRSCGTSWIMSNGIMPRPSVCAMLPERWGTRPPTSRTRSLRLPERRSPRGSSSGAYAPPASYWLRHRKTLPACARPSVSEISVILRVSSSATSASHRRNFDPLATRRGNKAASSPSTAKRRPFRSPTIRITV